MAEKPDLKPDVKPSAPPTTLAAVDLGSNSFHMVVARVAGHTMTVLDRLREPVRLAAMLAPDGTLPEAEWPPALACLERFRERLRGLPPSAVRAVGTNTLRRARNADAFLEAAAQALDQPIDVISGIEEARLIYLGVAHSTGGGDQQRLVLDIGGGSTELIIGHGLRPKLMESLHLGCVAQTQAYFADGRITPRRMDNAVLAAAMEFEPVVARFRACGWQDAFGASGTVQAIVEALQGLEGGLALDASGLRALRGAVLRAGSADGLARLGIKAERRPVFAGGLSIALGLFETLAPERLQVATSALREGLLYDLLGRLHQADMRATAVAELARRFHVDQAHGARVAQLAAGLLEQARGAWKLDEPLASTLLEWAAQTHEIGLDVAHAGHHKHGAYILTHGDLPGFARHEQHLLALLVRAHRRKFPVAEYAALPAAQRLWLARLAVLLRLAVTLTRSRVDNAPVPQLRLATDELALRFPPGWLAAHPLTEADLALEADFLRPAGYVLSFA